MSSIILGKIERLARGGAPRVVDLFSGCGGISLGFSRAGFRIDAAVEFDPNAAQSHADNFHRTAEGEAKRKHTLPRDIASIEPAELVSQLALGPVDDAVDVVVGGPPCQAYARVGRAKLRDVAEHPEAFKVDPRANLYLRYLHYVEALKPLAILMENVPDILNFGGHNIAEEIAEMLEPDYVVRYTLVNAAHYGVPQMRDRVFLIGYRRELRVPVGFPKATHWFELPAGYHGTRNVALKHIGLFSSMHYMPADLGHPDLPSAVTAKEALDDLPPITAHLEGRLRRGKRSFDTLAPYANHPPSEFARSMREWPGFQESAGVYDHVIRFLPRDPPIFREMKPGDEYPQAHKAAMRLFERRVSRHKSRGREYSPSELANLQRSMVPPYPVGTFPNRWWKLRPDMPSRTLMAHLGKDTYSHIHYDSRQARVISVREAARLQSFPDGFKFSGAMNAAFRQIGNAVPPLLAFRLGEAIMGTLRRAAGHLVAPVAAE